MALQIVYNEGGVERSVALQDVELRIGRGGDNAIVIRDPRSSRHHCALELTPQGVVLTDLKSRNGTVVGGAPITQCLLGVGDAFSVGSIRFQLVDAEAPQATSAPLSPADTMLQRAETHVVSPEPATVSSAAPAAPPAAPPATRAPQLVLEATEGPLAGQRLPLPRGETLIGRAEEAQVQIQGDKRVSARHARLIFDGKSLILEDLESTNGTAVNGDTIRRRALQVRDRIQIGKSVFVVAGQGGAGAGGSRGSAVDDEEVLRVDAERIFERSRSEQPLIVVGLVAIAITVAYFAVGVARRWSGPGDLDPSPEGNLIARNWSFEARPAAGAAKADGVPGWALGAGDQGAFSVTREGAQLPGLWALRLESTGDPDVCRVQADQTVVLGRDRRYRVQGYVRNRGAFAAALVVEWLRDSSGEKLALGRSVSEAARLEGEAIDVDQVVTAPPTATEARIACAIFGRRGAAIFDRIALFGAGSAEEEGKPWLRRFATAPEGDPVTVVLENDGAFSLASARRVLVSALWPGLDSRQDPLLIGPRLARVGVQDAEASRCDMELADSEGASWVTVETRGSQSGGDVVLEWRAAATPEREVPRIHVFIEPRDRSLPVEFLGGSGAPGEGPAEGARADDASSAPEPVGDLAREIVVGDGQDRLSIAFPEPRPYRRIAHPSDATRSIIEVEGYPGSMALRLSRGSREAESAARRLLREAEDAFAARRVGPAIQLLERLQAAHPDEAAPVEEARQRIAEWRAAGEASLRSLEEELATYRKSSSEVLSDLLRSRATALEESYTGTSLGESAHRLLEQLSTSCRDVAAAAEQKANAAVLAAARERMQRGDNAGAELLLRWLTTSATAGDLQGPAESALKIVESRKTNARKMILQSR